MPLIKFTPEEIQSVAGKNPLRKFPSLRNGLDRLFPYARPQIRTDLQFTEDTEFFIAGNCFGRNLEKALTRAGKKFSSSPKNLGLPGSVQEQYNRYNVVNLDVTANEIIWAIDENAQPLDDALIQVGDEWVDMQIHWTFAHDLDQARKYRQIYNSSFAPIADADVVVFVLGGFEQWFDRETNLYMNGMPTRKMTSLYPDRFEFHQVNETCEQSIRRCVEVVLANSKKNPTILLSLTPGQQPLVFGQNDIMIELALAKSYQRIAIERVCSDYSQVEYLPSREFAELSDTKFTYMETSLNHPKQNLANRVVAEVLLKYEGETPGYLAVNAIGHAEALFLAEDYAGAVQLCEAAIDSGAPLSIDLDFQYVQALRRNGESSKAVSWTLGRLDDLAPEEKERAVKLIANIARSHGTVEQIDEIIEVVKSILDDSDLIEALEKAKAPRAHANLSVSANMGLKMKVGPLLKERQFEEVFDLCVEALANSESTDADKQSLIPYVMQSCTQLGRKRSAVEFIVDVAEGLDGKLNTRWSDLLINLAKSHSDDPLRKRMKAISEKLSRPNEASQSLNES